MKGGIYMAIFFRYKWKIAGIMVVVALLIGTQCVKAEETLQMYSGSYALMDGTTERVLIGKNEENPMANASTTKILTCIVTLENASLEEMVTVSANAASQPKVRYGIQEGETYSLRELVYGLMLESYNDCAVAIAEHVAGNEEAFATLLNEKAKEIGCKDTYFITPNGLDAEDENGMHHTTAADLCRIMAYCVWESPMKDLFLEITQTKSYGPFVNRNAFLDQMEGVLSGKTGFTSKAGYCYVAALEENGERYTIALLACGWPNNKTYKWKDARTLFTYGQENYDVKSFELKTVLEGAEHNGLEVDGYINEPSFIMLNNNAMMSLEYENRSYQLLMAVKERLRIEAVLEEDINMPLEKGTAVGKYKIFLGDTMIDEIPIVTRDSASSWKFIQVLEVIIRQFLSCAT